jgi:hypothetical protein
MECFVVHKYYKFLIVFILYGLSAAVLRADGPLTLHPSDGEPVTGEILSVNPDGVILKIAEDNYTPRISWGRLSQADLKALLQEKAVMQNQLALRNIEPFIEIPMQEKIKRTEVPIKDVPRLPRPAGHSLLGGIFGSGIGLFLVLVIYAGNLYAAYEISIFRARPVGLVCGVAAVAPIIGPVIFLSLGPQLAAKEPEWNAPAEEYADPAVAAAIAAEQGGAGPAAALGVAQAKPATQGLPPAKVFTRGQYTFNRRFFETQMPTFFAVTRVAADKDMVLTFKATRGTHIVQRIARITANELYVQAQRGSAFEEVVIPFAEIQEVQIKHKNAA